jgi:hypothetical protein
MLPSLNEKHICDVRDEDFRGSKEGMGLLGFCSVNSPASIVLVPLYFMRAYYHSTYGDRHEALLDYRQVLTILPPVKSIPCEVELWIRFICGKLLWGAKRYDEAACDFRVCAAATRLLMHHDLIDLTKDFLQELHAVNIEVVKAKLMAERVDKRSRPYFDPLELDALNKELGIGPYSKSKYKCFFCGVSRLNEKLFPCPKCQMVWFCNQDCLNASWKEHKNPCRSDTEMMQQWVYDDLLEKCMENEYPCFEMARRYPDENEVSFYC